MKAQKSGVHVGREKEEINWEWEVMATVWWSLTQEFRLRSREAVEDEADTGRALCAGAPLLPRSLSSPIHSHIAPPAPPAIHQSGHKGAAAQWGHIKAFSRWEAQGWCWHNTEEHRRKQGRPVRKKRESKWNGKKESNQNKTFHSLHKPALCQPSIPKTQTHFSHCLEPMAPLSMWTGGII